MSFGRLIKLVSCLALMLPFTFLDAAVYSYSYIPKKIYASQVFPVTILASGIPSGENVRFEFDSSNGVKPINPDPVKLSNGNDFFYTFYFRANGENDLIIPKLVVRDGNDTQVLPDRQLHIYKLESSSQKDFCGLIASDCTLLSSQVSMFDENNTLVSIKFKAHEANPEAIHIPIAGEEGLEKIERKNSLVNAEYYFVIPSSYKDVNLSYFNTIQHRFVTFKIKTDYHSQPVAAQVELNPKASWFESLKKYGTVALALFFGLMFWWQRDWLYMIIFVSLLFLLYLIYRPEAALCVREGAPLYILPTHSSRISTNIDKRLFLRPLGQHEDYYKINYRNGIIGWINEEDLCKD